MRTTATCSGWAWEPCSLHPLGRLAVIPPQRWWTGALVVVDCGCGLCGWLWWLTVWLAVWMAVVVDCGCGLVMDRHGLGLECLLPVLAAPLPTAPPASATLSQVCGSVQQ